MAKDIQLNSQEWADMVFADKNRAYGAYQLRLGSSKRHIMALIAVTISAVVIAAIPSIVSTVRKAFIQQDGISTSVELANLKDLEKEQEIKKEDEIVRQEAPPPPPLKSTIQFTVPEIVDASEITEDNEMKSQDDLAAAKEQISVATVKGTDDLNAIDIADLDQHKVIVEAPKEEEVFVSVEQNPEFPGGMEELYKFLNNSIKYPPVAAEMGIQGRATLRFVVEKDGSIANVEVLRGFDKSCDAEAVRVVKSLPRFQPGRQNGRAVRVYYTLPVTFRLASN